MNLTHNPPTPVEVRPTPAELLRGAAVYLQRHGWTQGDYYATSTDATNHDAAAFPPACIVGALGMAAYGEPLHEDLFSVDRDELCALRHAIDTVADLIDLDEDDLSAVKACGYDPTYTPAHLFVWNDTDGRTAAQVIQTLHDAADEWNRTTTPLAALLLRLRECAMDGENA